MASFAPRYTATTSAYSKSKAAKAKRSPAKPAPPPSSSSTAKPSTHDYGDWHKGYFIRQGQTPPPPKPRTPTPPPRDRRTETRFAPTFWDHYTDSGDLRPVDRARKRKRDINKPDPLKRFHSCFPDEVHPSALLYGAVERDDEPEPYWFETRQAEEAEGFQDGEMSRHPTAGGGGDPARISPERLTPYPTPYASASNSSGWGKPTPGQDYQSQQYSQPTYQHQPYQNAYQQQSSRSQYSSHGYPPGSSSELYERRPTADSTLLDALMNTKSVKSANPFATGSGNPNRPMPPQDLDALRAHLNTMRETVAKNEAMLQRIVQEREGQQSSGMRMLTGRPKPSSSSRRSDERDHRDRSGRRSPSPQSFRPRARPTSSSAGHRRSPSPRRERSGRRSSRERRRSRSSSPSRKRRRSRSPSPARRKSGRSRSPTSSSKPRDVRSRSPPRSDRAERRHEEKGRSQNPFRPKAPEAPSISLATDKPLDRVSSFQSSFSFYNNAPPAPSFNSPPSVGVGLPPPRTAPPLRTAPPPPQFQHGGSSDFEDPHQTRIRGPTGGQVERLPLAMNFIITSGAPVDPNTLKPSDSSVCLARGEWASAARDAAKPGSERITVLLVGDIEPEAVTNLAGILSRDGGEGKVLCVGNQRLGWKSMAMEEEREYLPFGTEVVVANRFFIPRGSAVHSITSLGLPLRYPEEAPMILDKLCEYMERIIANQEHFDSSSRRNLVLNVCLDISDRETLQNVRKWYVQSGQDKVLPTGGKEPDFSFLDAAGGDANIRLPPPVPSGNAASGFGRWDEPQGSAFPVPHERERDYVSQESSSYGNFSSVNYESTGNQLSGSYEDQGNFPFWDRDPAGNRASVERSRHEWDANPSRGYQDAESSASWETRPEEFAPRSSSSRGDLPPPQTPAMSKATFKKVKQAVMLRCEFLPASAKLFEKGFLLGKHALQQLRMFLSRTYKVAKATKISFIILGGPIKKGAVHNLVHMINNTVGEEVAMGLLGPPGKVSAAAGSVLSAPKLPSAIRVVVSDALYVPDDCPSVLQVCALGLTRKGFKPDSLDLNMREWWSYVRALRASVAGADPKSKTNFPLVAYIVKGSAIQDKLAALMEDKSMKEVFFMVASKGNPLKPLQAQAKRTKQDEEAPPELSKAAKRKQDRAPSQYVNQGDEGPNVFVRFVGASHAKVVDKDFYNFMGNQFIKKELKQHYASWLHPAARPKAKDKAEAAEDADTANAAVADEDAADAAAAVEDAKTEETDQDNRFVIVVNAASEEADFLLFRDKLVTKLGGEDRVQCVRHDPAAHGHRWMDGGAEGGSADDLFADPTPVSERTRVVLSDGFVPVGCGADRRVAAMYCLGMPREMVDAGGGNFGRFLGLWRGFCGEVEKRAAGSLGGCEMWWSMKWSRLPEVKKAMEKYLWKNVAMPRLGRCVIL